MDIDIIQTHTKEQILALFVKLENIETKGDSIEPKLGNWSNDLNIDVDEFKASFLRCYIARDGWPTINDFIDKTVRHLELIKLRLKKNYNPNSINGRNKITINLKYIDDLVNFITEYDLKKDIKNHVLEKENIIKPKLKYTNPVIALIHIYSNDPITKENSNTIAKKYYKTSGLGLLNWYKHYNNYKPNITAATLSKVENKHNIARLQLVADIFADKVDIQNEVLTDLSKLKDAIDKNDFQ